MTVSHYWMPVKRFFYGGYRAGGGRLRGEQLGDFDADGGAQAGEAFDAQQVVLTVEHLQALVDVGDADAALVDLGDAVGGDADPVVFDFDNQAAVVAGGAQADLPAFQPRPQAVADGVLDDGLQEHAGDDNVEGFVVGLFAELELLRAAAGT